MPKTISSRAGVVVALVALALGLATAVSAATDPYDLVPGTAVLADNFDSGNGGNGGNTSSTSSSTSIFPPSVFVDYKRFGGEPTVTGDRYPGGDDVTDGPGPNRLLVSHHRPVFQFSDPRPELRVP